MSTRESEMMHDATHTHTCTKTLISCQSVAIGNSSYGRSPLLTRRLGAMMRDAQCETFNLNRTLSDGSIAFRLLRLALVVGPLGRKPTNSHVRAALILQLAVSI